MLGIVVATVIAEGLKYALLTYFAQRYVAYEIAPGPLRCQFYAAVAMFVVVEPLHRLVGVGSWFDLLSIIGVGALIYVLSLIALSDVFMLTAHSIFDDARERYS